MSSGMTDEELQAARTLVDAATPGPWEASSHGTMKDGSPNKDWFATGMGNTLTHVTESTARFVAASRTLVPVLLAEVDRLRAEIRKVQP